MAEIEPVIAAKAALRAAGVDAKKDLLQSGSLPQSSKFIGCVGLAVEDLKSVTATFLKQDTPTGETARWIHSLGTPALRVHAVPLEHRPYVNPVLGSAVELKSSEKGPGLLVLKDEGVYEKHYGSGGARALLKANLVAIPQGGISAFLHNEKNTPANYVGLLGHELAHTKGKTEFGAYQASNSIYQAYTGKAYFNNDNEILSHIGQRYQFNDKMTAESYVPAVLERFGVNEANSELTRWLPGGEQYRADQRISFYDLNARLLSKQDLAGFRVEHAAMLELSPGELAAEAREIAEFGKAVAAANYRANEMELTTGDGSLQPVVKRGIEQYFNENWKAGDPSLSPEARSVAAKAFMDKLIEQRLQPTSM